MRASGESTFSYLALNFRVSVFWQTMIETPPEQGDAIVHGKRPESSDRGTEQLTSKSS